MKYGFIGFGNLAKAIYQGLSNSDIEFAYIEKNGEKHEGLELFDSLEKLVSFSDVIWVCVKPQNIVEVLEELKNYDLNNKIIVSPVAGKSISFFEKYLGNTTIVRIMPNLAMAYGKSVTAFCANNENNELVKKVKEDLSKLGKVAEINENKFDLFTAIFGSGPAFLLEIFKIFKNKSIELGIEESLANDMLLQLVDGTATYFKNNNKEKSIDELVQNIASRGGVTEAGLNSFKENNIEKLLKGVLESAENKSKEMGK